jgi:hypothetical protein
MNEVIKQQLSEAKAFVSDFITDMTSDSMNESAKQAYFLDNQSEVKKTFGFLNNLKSMYDSVVSEDIVTEEDSQVHALVTGLIDTLSETLNNYREGLKANPNITKEETTVVVNEETLKQALKEDSSTKKMVEDMQALSAQKPAQSGEYNYMIVVSKTQPYYVYAPTKQELIGLVNQVADSTPGATIEVFEIKYTAVPLKTATKTVYTL